MGRTRLIFIGAVSFDINQRRWYVEGFHSEYRYGIAKLGITDGLSSSTLVVLRANSMDDVVKS